MGCGRCPPAADLALLQSGEPAPDSVDKPSSAPAVLPVDAEQARDLPKGDLPDALPQTVLSVDTAGQTDVPEPAPVVPKSEPPSSADALTELPFAQPDVSPGKRTREDSEDDNDERRVRPRTETYESPQGDAPGLLDWLLLPIRTFVRGFKEGMSSS